MGMKLPSGKEISLSDVIKFCYDLSDTDLEVLFKLLKEGEKTVDDISAELGLSKASISRALNKLLGLGFIERRRLMGPASVGRPKYIYTTSKERIETKIRKDMDHCVKIVREFMSKLLKEEEIVSI